ncbi:lysophospholipid acyltransferase LPEAT1-like [Hibiscus syriacus]|uniref:lysophospholipid acyltransferase LPEAT1-like n=1 Tax=Hibiscus syriacus TaxID=106335 RepID=UPI0019207CF6|nr:lysophospholipid acyltransferase LPEAT1-like [Hibiscus syriacus]XP_039061714.1 lysophospholipid acyltransferase LPEAT1-like [Hibiscus syriacus]
MESELKDLNSKSDKIHPPDSTHDGASAKDDRPLLKSDSSSAASSAAAGYNIQELEKKFAAYVRNDVFGTMGRGELPLKEKFLLGIALVTLLPLRIVFGMAILVVFYLICRICTLFFAPNREEEQEDYAHLGGWRRAVIVRLGRFLSRSLLFVAGFYWINETPKDSSSSQENSKNEGTHVSEENEPPGAIVSNHVSYIDILYHMSSSFPSFVAKRSVAKIPFVGLISKCLGCVYVQRESKSSDFKGVAGVVTDRVHKAHQNKSAPMMMLFPEGTTTNGDYLLPFKTGAFLAGAPMVPVILRYPYQRFSPAWDTITGVRHVVLLLCQFVNHMEVIHLPIYYPSQQEKDDPKQYANNVRRLMATEGNLIISDVGLAEK